MTGRSPVRASGRSEPATPGSSAILDSEASRHLGAGAAHWIILAISLLNLVVVAGTFMWVMQPSELHSPLLAYKIVLGMGVLSAVLTVGALVYTVLGWRDGYRGIASRVYHTLVTVAAVALVWFLNYWNMLGWRF